MQVLRQVANHFWPDSSTYLKMVPNVQIKTVGNVDWFIVKINRENIDDFIGVEIQAIDITGSVRPAFGNFINREPLQKSPSFGINYRNVCKRLLAQLLEKGRCFKTWRKKLAVIVQDALFYNLQQKINFAPVQDQLSDIVFFVYSLDVSNHENYSLALDKTMGMSYESLLTHVMYAEVPSLEEIITKPTQRMASTGDR